MLPTLQISDINAEWEDAEGSEIYRNQAYIAKIKPIRNFLFKETEYALYIEETRWTQWQHRNTNSNKNSLNSKEFAMIGDTSQMSKLLRFSSDEGNNEISLNVHGADAPGKKKDKSVSMSQRSVSGSKSTNKIEANIEATNRWVKIVKIGIFACIMLLIAAGSASTVTIKNVNDNLNDAISKINDMSIRLT
jgi:hypothetical protein